MFPLLILREEFICLVLLVFLWFTGRIYHMGKDRASFRRIILYAMGHVVFDVVTVLTVNHLDTVPQWVNLAAHVIFYLFAILFAREFFCYVMELCFSKASQAAARRWTLALVILYLLLLPLLPIDYLTGRGTNYSFGPAAIGGYALAMLLFLVCGVVILIRFRALEKHVQISLIPMLCVLIIVECMQVLVPELLFTGGAMTIVAVGFFFSLENPVIVFRQKLLTDAMTGVKSRQSYTMDIAGMEEEYARNRHKQFGFVFCDINNLKMVNDTLGHPEGDAYISRIAQMLLSGMKAADGVYRMGGDEFLVIYRGKSAETIRADIENVQRQSESMGCEQPYAVSIAMGFAMSGESYRTLKDVIRVADYLMYQNKLEMKKSMAFVRASGEETVTEAEGEGGRMLNISGLTNRIYDALAALDEHHMLVLTNLSTNVTRWPKPMVEEFALSGEFVVDGINVWAECIHPDDREAFLADVHSVLSGERKIHHITYRVKNCQGQYVKCTSHGTILRGSKGEPDLLAAAVVNEEGRPRSAR